MKVLHLFPEFLRGGAPVNTLRFIRASQKTLEHVAAGNVVDAEFADEFRPYAQILDVDLSRPYPRSFLKLLKAAKQAEADIVHANGKAGMFYGLLLSIFLPGDTRFYLTLRGFHDKFHGLKSSFYRFLERLMARRADAVICVSPSERKHYLELIKADEEKVIIIPNGIDINEKKLSEEMLEVCRDFRVNIVSLSRTTPQKDLENMICSFERATDGKTDTALHIMGGLSHGEEDYQKKINELWRSSDATDRIFFWGDVKEAGNLICNFDVYLSTARFEGLPTAIVESFLSRVPVVGTDCIGNIDLIRDGETGWLTPVGDIDAVGKALSEAINNIGSNKEHEIVDHAFDEGQKFSIKRQAENLINLYNNKY